MPPLVVMRGSGLPALDLFVSAPRFGTPVATGNLDLAPPVSGLNRVLLRQLVVALRVPRVPGVFEAILDTGAPLAIFPHDVWYNQFNGRVGRDFEDLSLAGIGPTLRGQVLSHRFLCRLARLRVPVELLGQDITGDRLRLDSLVCQLAETGGPPSIILGLWGGAFTGRRLVVEPQPNSDELDARLEF